MGKKNGKLTLEDLKTQIIKDRFDNYLALDKEAGAEFLAEYGIFSRERYKGIFYKDSCTVKIFDIKNPFSTRDLVVKVHKGNIHVLEDRQVVVVELIVGRMKSQKPTHENIFACDIIGKVQNPKSMISAPLESKEIMEKKHELMQQLQSAEFREKAKQEIARKRALELDKQVQLDKEQTLIHKAEENEYRRKESIAKERKQKKIEAYQNGIRDVLERRRIKRLYHFTRIENLQSILTHGLLSVTEMSQKKITRFNNDHRRYDGKKNCISLSVEYPNSDNLRRFMDDREGSKWIVLAIDPEVILNHKCYFAEHNAASHSIATCLDDRMSPESFENMFAKEINVAFSHGRRTIDRYPGSPSYWPTSLQAEILVDGKIDPEYITAIYFQDETDKDSYKGKIRGKRLLVNELLFKKSRYQYRNFREY